MQIFVLGMHRSGTSALARVLNLLGCYFGVEEIGTGANEENVKGFWERRDVRRVNDQILHESGHDWNRVSDFKVDGIDGERIALYRRLIGSILLNMDAHRPWFIKEPRLCLTFPLWRPLLEMPICIHIHRNPLDVARSLQMRNDIPLSAGLALWERYNIDALNASKGVNRLIVSYEHLMESPLTVVRWIIEAAKDQGYRLRRPRKAELLAFLDIGLQHHRSGLDECRAVASQSQMSLYEWLVEAETAGMDSGTEIPAIGLSNASTLADYESRSERNVLGSDRAAAEAVAVARNAGLTTDLALARFELQREKKVRERFEREAVRLREEAVRLREEAVRLREDGERHQRETAEHSAKIRESESEISRLRTQISDLGSSKIRLKLEVGGLEATLQRKDRELLATMDRVEATEEARAELQAKAQQTNRKLSDAINARQTATRESHRAKTLLDEVMVNVGLLLSSRRWRLGDAALSLHRSLLRRQRLPTVADHLAKLLKDVDDPGRDHGMQRDRVSHATGPDAPVRSPPGTRAYSGEGKAVSKLSTPLRPSKVTVLVLAWDVGHNPLGRAYLLAEALSRSYQVVLAGFQFPRYGDSVWRPLRYAPFRIVAIPGNTFPDFQGTLESLAERVDADVVVACKARLPSVQAGLMMKALRNRPLIVDIDDYELAFFDSREPLDDVSGQPASALQEPFEEVWTRYTETLLTAADSILVSNAELQRKFGGVEVPHARDETVFRVGATDRIAARRQLGLGTDQKVVMFVGTPRPHKGVIEVLDAVKQASRNHNCCFVIVGKAPDPTFERALKNRGRASLRMIPDQPFHRLPALLSAADVVCAMQDPNAAVAQYQLPAKIVDAIAMAVPVLATDVPPLRHLIEAGAVHAVSHDNLAASIGRWLDMSERDRLQHVSRARNQFLDRFSYRAINRTLVEVVESCLTTPRQLPRPTVDFLNGQADRFPCSPGLGHGIDVVMFWKQGDTGLYGRRFDMLVDRLARRAEIRRIAVFDAPFSAHHLWAEGVDEPLTHHQQVCQDKLIRRWGLVDSEKVSHHVFLFDNHGNILPREYPDESCFADFVAEELARVDIDPRDSIFWYYPVLEAAEVLNARFEPRLKVVDVVDDQRTWPGRSANERAKMTNHYRNMLLDADIALCNCETVKTAMAEYADLTVVPNGCDTDPIPEDPEDRQFARLLQLEGPIVGLAGNLESKTDSALLERLAKDRPGYQLVLVGSTHSNAAIRRLDAYDNVFFAGVVRYPMVKAWIKRFDVALLPHLDTEQTRAMHPLKLLVYASLGVRIVATGIHNLGEFAPFVDVADDHETFLKAVDDAVSDNSPPDEEALLRTVESNSWERRVDLIMDRIQAKLATPSEVGNP